MALYLNRSQAPVIPVRFELRPAVVNPRSEARWITGILEPTEPQPQCMTALRHSAFQVRELDLVEAHVERLQRSRRHHSACDVDDVQSRRGSVSQRDAEPEGSGLSASGRQDAHAERGTLAPGIYFVRLRQGAQVAHTRTVFLR